MCNFIATTVRVCDECGKGGRVRQERMRGCGGQGVKGHGAVMARLDLRGSGESRNVKTK